MKRLLIALGVLGGLGLWWWVQRTEDAEVVDGQADERPSEVQTRTGEPPTRTLRPRDRSEASDPAGRRAVADPSEAPFRTFASKAAPRWQGLSLELRRQGEEDLADETWSMADWLRRQRLDPERDDRAILEAQVDLLARVEESAALDEAARRALESVREVVGVYEGEL